MDYRHSAISDMKFYDKYHDSFCIEWDAVNYATIQLIKLYGKQYSKEVNSIVSEEQDRKRIDWPTFYLMELKEYENIINRGLYKRS